MEDVEDGSGNSIRWISVNLGAFKILGFLRYYFLARKTIKDVRPDVICSCSDTIYAVLGYRKAVRESDGVSCVSESLRRHIADAYRRNRPTSVITNAAHLAVAGYRTPDTRIPGGESIHDLGLLSPADVPLFLNSLDLAVVYNRSSTFGDFCFPQKFYEILACGIPVVVADVGELGRMLEHKPHLKYQDGDMDSLVSALQLQLRNRELLDLEIPSWSNQAELLQQLMQTAVSHNLL